MITAIIVDDEFKSREILSGMVKEFCNEIGVVDSLGTVSEAVAAIHKNKPDLVFLDIDMNDETGFDLLERTADIKFSVIFTTAYEQYALKAIKYSAADYLLKPINVEELKNAVVKIKRDRENNPSQLVNDLIKKLQSFTLDNQQISISSSTGLTFIKTLEIVWLEAEGAYTKFHMQNNQVVLSSKRIKEYEKILPNSIFFRVHNSSVINLNEIVKYVRGAGGYVIMSDGSSIIVSRQRKVEFLKKIGA
jgi:two-component system LytT family response regulator